LLLWANGTAFHVRCLFFVWAFRDLGKAETRVRLVVLSYHGNSRHLRQRLLESLFLSLPSISVGGFVLFPVVLFAAVD
jgi:hypothetical protein